MGKNPRFIWDIQRLDRSHDKTSFDCGNPQLNEWLKRFAGQYERRDLSRTYVALQPGELRILGYYSISNHQVNYEALPEDQAKGLPRIDIPVVCWDDSLWIRAFKDKDWVNIYLLMHCVDRPISRGISGFGPSKSMPLTKAPAVFI